MNVNAEAVVLSVFILVPPSPVSGLSHSQAASLAGIRISKDLSE